MSTVHVVPVDDLIEHDTDLGDCVCGPEVEPVERDDDGSLGWLVKHHSLDGREMAEPDSVEGPSTETSCGDVGG